MTLRTVLIYLAFVNVVELMTTHTLSGGFIPVKMTFVAANTFCFLMFAGQPVFSITVMTKADLAPFAKAVACLAPGSVHAPVLIIFLMAGITVFFNFDLIRILYMTGRAIDIFMAP